MKLSKTTIMNIQTTARTLGYAGLIPFVGLALLTHLQTFPELNIVSALLFYGAIILSFTGALHWGFGMSMSSFSDSERNRRLIWSIIPALIAWLALLCPTYLCVYLLIVGFILQFWQDYRLTKNPKALIPSWFLPLRMQLTTIAILSLASLFFQT